MNTSLQTVHRIIRVLLLLAVVQIAAHGQSQPAARPPAPQASPTPSLERRFVKNILRDQRAIWTAPFKMERGDARWLAPLGISTAALLATDRHTAGELTENGDNRTRLRISSDISRGGSIYATSAIAGTFYLLGRTTHNARARETGLLSMEALIDSGIVTTVLKTVSQRPRPRIDDASGEFFDRGNSFPSGHASSAWSVATVIAYEYGKGRPLVRFAAYGLATAVSLSRYTGSNHFLSDVLIGSAIGFGVGRYVYRTHHDPSLDGGDGAAKSYVTRSRLIPMASPIYSRAERAYGVSLAWNF
ncbi:MAG TPA: phosphatase PAP2 family protein [Pyrinomonadaceae bacterium]|jgi:membrane-associated phospholipid phosphatase